MIPGLTEFVIVIVGLILSGFYSGSEAALISMTIDRTRQLIEQGGRNARAFKFLHHNVDAILTTILIGNNLVNIFVASYITKLASAYFQNEAVGISVGITTVGILIFGEILPKTFAKNHAEKVVVPIIRVLRVNYYLLFPIVKLVTFIIHFILGKNAQLSGRVITKNDLEFMINKAWEDQSMDSKQLDLLNSILEFPTIKVKDIMIPRNKIKYVRYTNNLIELLEVIKEHGHSRYPVCEEDLEQTLGFLHVKDLVFLSINSKKKFVLKKFIKAPFFVYEHMKIPAVFDTMNRKKVHLALVKNEVGVITGIVTLEDIMEEIFGEIQDEHDEDLSLSKDLSEEGRGEDGVIVNGSISIRDLNNEFDLKLPIGDNYSTLAGFLLEMLGSNFPKKGTIIVWEGISFELFNVDSQQISEVKMKYVEEDRHLFSKSRIKNELEQSSPDLELVENPSENRSIEDNTAENEKKSSNH